MSNEEAYERLRAQGVSRHGALDVLTYAYWAQLSGGWANLFIPGTTVGDIGGSEGAKGNALDILRSAGIDPMVVTFPERVSGRPPFGAN